MITLYAFGRVLPQVVGHTRDLRAQWALEETGLPYQIEALDFCAGELKSPAYHQLNPFEQIPIINDDGFIVAESAAIVLYLAEKSGRLIPDDLRGRTQVTQWSFAAMNTLEPVLFQIAMIDSANDADPSGPARRAPLAKMAAQRLAALDERLSNRAYLATDDFSAADLLMTHVLRELQTTELLDDRPRLKSYLARCENRPAWHRAAEAYDRRLGAERGTTLGIGAALR